MQLFKELIALFVYLIGLNESKLIQDYSGLLGGNLDEQLDELLPLTLSKTKSYSRNHSVSVTWLSWRCLVGITHVSFSKVRMKALKLAFYWLWLREVPLNWNISVHSNAVVVKIVMHSSSENGYCGNVLKIWKHFKISQNIGDWSRLWKSLKEQV